MYHLKTRFGCVVAISNNLCTNKEDNDELNRNWRKKNDGKKNIYTRNDQKQESAKANKINKHSFFCAAFDAIVRYQNQNFLAKPQRVYCIVNISQLLCQCCICSCAHTILAICYFILLLLLAISAINFPYLYLFLCIFLFDLSKWTEKYEKYTHWLVVGY